MLARNLHVTGRDILEESKRQKVTWSHIDRHVSKGAVWHAAAPSLAGDFFGTQIGVGHVGGVDVRTVSAETSGWVENRRGREGLLRVGVQSPVPVAIRVSNVNVNMLSHTRDLAALWFAKGLSSTRGTHGCAPVYPQSVLRSDS